MTNISHFDGTLNMKIRMIRAAKARLMRDVALYTYTLLQQNWPAYTYWSKMNNQVAFGVRAFPIIGRRPKWKNGLRGEAQRMTELNLQRIRSHDWTPETKCFIGTSVAYARDVSFISGNGDRIYANAAREGRAIATALAKQRGEL